MLRETTNITSERLYTSATGSIPYSLLNDCMFHIITSKYPHILKGLIAALLHMVPTDITDIEIKNPITPGQSVEDKYFILDIMVCINHNAHINLEIQVINEHNWQDRSLSYLCRSYDNLSVGQDYDKVQPAIHIGILDFQPFQDNLEFHATYKILNIKNQHLYSSKFSLHVVDLTHIELATEEDSTYGIDIWAKLFKATTWEDIKMIASDNQYIADCADALYVSNEDYVIREQCRAREEAIKREKHHIETIAALNQQHEQDKAALQEKDTALQEKDAEIAQLKALLARNTTAAPN